MPPGRTQRFFQNVLWNFLWVGTNLVAGFVLSPYLVRKLGAEGYGIWVLASGLMDYYYLLDLGFRSATVKYAAHYKASGEPNRINEIINTGLLYFSGLGLLLLAVTAGLCWRAGTLFQIAPGYRWVFGFLILLVGLSWSIGSVFGVFDSCLEAFQRFDLSGRIMIFSTTLRTAGSFAVLLLGYGMAALGLMVFASQMTGYLLSYLCLRSIFPELRLSFRLSSRGALRDMVRYGVHTFVSNAADRILNQNAQIMIGHYRPVAQVGYYNVPLRLLQYSADVVYRIGNVSRASAAELSAKGELPAVAQLGIYSNRYSLVISLPVAIFLLVWGYNFVRVWINPEFARASAFLFPILLPGAVFAIAGQFNSSSILFGLGKHQGFARGMMAEAVVSTFAMLALVKPYGIAAAAAVTTGTMLLNRSALTGWLVCRHLQFPLLAYLTGIYLRPLVLAIPVTALAFAVKPWLPGSNWLQLIAAAALVAGTYLGASIWACLTREHRSLMFSWVRDRLHRR